MDTKPKTIHLVMRFSDSLFGGVSTIEEHARVIGASGAVWMAKLGKPLAESNRLRLAEQISRREPTYVFLVQRVGREYEWFRGRLTSVANAPPRAEKRLSPSYYEEHGIRERAPLWLRIDHLSAAPRSQVRLLRVLRSGRLVSDVLLSSMAALFIVFRAKGRGNDVVKREREREGYSLTDAVLDAFEEDDW